MPLTPTDVANKQFRIAFRGYSLDEVDAFLDEVENELTRLLRSGSESQARTPSAVTSAVPSAVPAVGTETPPAVEAPAPEPLSGLQGQEAALRTLLLAQRTADEAIAEARAEADELLAAARAEAERTVREAAAEADRTLSTSREKAARVDEDVAAKVQAATGDLDVRRRQLEGRIEELRAFEREYRTRLKAYLETQLRELGSGARPTEDAGSGVPADARTAAVGGGPAARPAAGPFAPRAPGGVPAGQDDGHGHAQSAPDGPPREADAAAVRPVAVPGSPVGPFTSMGPGAGDAPAADTSADR